MSKKSMWDKFKDFPPIVCRLLSRTGEEGAIRPLSTAEIATTSGLTTMQVMSLSWRDSWDDVPFRDMKRFSEACGVYLDNRNNLRKHTSYIKGMPTWKYLRKSPLWRELFEPLIREYLHSRVPKESNA